MLKEHTCLVYAPDILFMSADWVDSQFELDASFDEEFLLSHDLLLTLKNGRYGVHATNRETGEDFWKIPSPLSSFQRK